MELTVSVGCHRQVQEGHQGPQAPHDECHWLRLVTVQVQKCRQKSGTFYLYVYVGHCSYARALARSCPPHGLTGTEWCCLWRRTASIVSPLDPIAQDLSSRYQRWWWQQQSGNTFCSSLSGCYEGPSDMVRIFFGSCVIDFRAAIRTGCCQSPWSTKDQWRCGSSVSRWQVCCCCRCCRHKSRNGATPAPNAVYFSFNCAEISTLLCPSVFLPFFSRWQPCIQRRVHYLPKNELRMNHSDSILDRSSLSTQNRDAKKAPFPRIAASVSSSSSSLSSWSSSSPSSTSAVVAHWKDQDNENWTGQPTSLFIPLCLEQAKYAVASQIYDIHFFTLFWSQRSSHLSENRFNPPSFLPLLLLLKWVHWNKVHPSLTAWVFFSFFDVLCTYSSLYHVGIQPRWLVISKHDYNHVQAWVAVVTHMLTLSKKKKKEQRL